MLEMLLPEFVLLSGGGARRDGEVAPDARLPIDGVVPLLDALAVVRKGRVAARLSPSVLVLKEPPSLLPPP
jgi:hypothetical protein